MRKYRGIRAALIAAALLALVTGRGHAVELGGFFEFTLYTEEGEPAEAFKPRVLLLLHGFKSAMPNYDYGVIHKAFAADRTVAGFNYDYTDVKENVEEFGELFETLLRDRSVVVIGTSLGGFWADYLVNRFELEGAVLVNPSVRPEETMRRALGEQYSKKRQEKFTVTEAAVAAYSALETPSREAARRLVLLSRDDEILDYQVAAEAFAGHPNTKVVVFGEGGHNLDLDRPEVMAEIRNFIDQRRAGK